MTLKGSYRGLGTFLTAWGEEEGEGVDFWHCLTGLAFRPTRGLVCSSSCVTTLMTADTVARALETETCGEWCKSETQALRPPEFTASYSAVRPVVF